MVQAMWILWIIKVEQRYIWLRKMVIQLNRHRKMCNGTHSIVEMNGAHSYEE